MKGRSKRAKASGIKIKTFKTKQGLRGLTKFVKTKDTTWITNVVSFKTKKGKVVRKTTETRYDK